MPELPEVETNMRNLARWARGRTIVGVVPPPGRREIGGAAPADLVRRLRGRRVERVERRGKWILCRLSGGGGLALHLGMSGKLARLGHPFGRGSAPADALPRFARAVLALDDGTRIVLVDARRFGKLLARPYDELAASPAIASVGPDALSGALAGALRAGLARTRRSVKEALLDQRIVGGIGNLYATEALWRARIHPATPAPDLDAAALRRLVLAIRAALRHGLAEHEGSELPAYLEDGAPNVFRVYGRAGERCPRCRTVVESIVLGGRTSAYCPSCQPLLRGRRRGRRAGGDTSSGRRRARPRG